MENRITITEWLKNFYAGAYNENDVRTQIVAGWYDWFCEDEELANKTLELGSKLSELVNVNACMENPIFDPDKSYVFFKNNCPVNGELYDDFRICDIATGDVIITVIPFCGHDSSFGEAQIWGTENKWQEPLADGTWFQVLSSYFGR